MAAKHYFSKQMDMQINVHNNQTGGLLAKQLTSLKAKERIKYLLDSDGQKKLNSQEIANAFISYDASLYNLREDTNKCQPQPKEILTFLQYISLPHLSFDQLTSLSTPISV